jgi:hypothetical protein
MLCRQTEYFLGKFGKLSKIPAGIFCGAVAAKAQPQTSSRRS